MTTPRVRRDRSLPPLPSGLSGLQKPPEAMPEDYEPGTRLRPGAAAAAFVCALAGCGFLLGGYISSSAWQMGAGFGLLTAVLVSAMASGAWRDDLQLSGLRYVTGNLPTIFICLALAAAVVYGLATILYVITRIDIVSLSVFLALLTLCGAGGVFLKDHRTRGTEPNILLAAERFRHWIGWKP